MAQAPRGVADTLAAIAVAFLVEANDQAAGACGRSFDLLIMWLCYIGSSLSICCVYAICYVSFAWCGYDFILASPTSSV